MKKILSLILMVVMLTAVFASCGDAPDNTTTTTTQGGQNNPGDGNNNIGSIPSTMPITKNDVEDFDSAITDKGFEIRGKKLNYTKGSNNALILNVKNTTDKNCSVTLTVNYFGADGVEILKTEKQSFTGFASGYDRYFLFQPNIAYDKYACSIEVTEYSGECLEQYINVVKCEIVYDGRTPIGKDSKGDLIWGEGIAMQFSMTNSYSEKLYYAANFIYFDNQGRLYSIDDFLKQKFIDANRSIPTGGDYRSVYYPDGNDIMALPNQLIWPDELKDNVTVIVIFKAVSTDWLV